jgi:conjugal transfer ATP-binding protein TraC
LLRLIIEEAQKPEDNSSISHWLCKKCKNHDKQEIKDIGVQLGPWCEGGIYGRRFTTSLPPIDFDSRFIVLELEELKPATSSVGCVDVNNPGCSMLFIKKDWRRRLFILDEAWEYIGKVMVMMQLFHSLLNSSKLHGVVSVKLCRNLYCTEF